jgi:cytochrome b pre-mRNA-processing protein 3
MLNRLFGRSRKDEVAAMLYEAAVAQARRPEFYLRAAVPDTLDGRFDLLALHVFLVLHRLRADGAQTAALAQALFDLMFDDMDANLREIGVGDLSVGRKVKTMAKALMGRIAAYEPGLADPALLAEALGRNLYRGRPVDPAAVAQVARYVSAAVADLAGQATEALAAGKIGFPEPALA